MNKLIAMLFTLFPVLAIADESSLSFAPPPSDYSVVFLGNIFGIVDGVLHGTGSQIMGAMFGVFNAAVLALGGIVIMYTLLVSTMNTAHEGQMLGQKWSSIWVPVRATIGLTLLIPKASGYCLMQIFVMWIVVQGVGAADKIWNAALGYLDRGGAIVQAQMNENPNATLDMNQKPSEVYAAAQIILTGQVCMIGLQTQLQTLVQEYQALLQAKVGPCKGSPTGTLGAFCKTGNIPDFVNTVNVVQYQNNHASDASFVVKMPNFDSDSIFSLLNGICGTIAWKSFSQNSLNKMQPIIPIRANDLNTAMMSRAIAIQQMYLDLATIARIMVNNDPALGKKSSSNNQSPFSAMADQQFGVPELATGAVCSDSTQNKCVLWGASSGNDTAVLLNGTEFPGAVQDYNAIMLPTLTLIKQAENNVALQNTRKFINDAMAQGWLMAGSYFFNLVSLNAQANATGNLLDTDTGLKESTFDGTLLTSSFQDVCQGTFADLCFWFQKDKSKLLPVVSLIDGTGVLNPTIPIPQLSSSLTRNVIDGIGSSTVFGYTNNSTILRLPGQPGMKPLKFAHLINISIDPKVYQLPELTFSCGAVDFGLIIQCLGALFGDLFYNVIFRFIYNSFLSYISTFINAVIMAFLQIPLSGMATIFDEGLKIISAPGANPVVALAQMGTYYINFAANLWLELIDLSIVSVLIPVFGVFIFALIAMTMPILFAWLGIMLQIGFSTAYYVPILPYMIFTFGAIAWLMAVIEAMVAAPIVALGVTHPEGHDAFGKGEQAVLILMNVFLRPAMMIIGYISAIALTYVSVWIINAGFDHAVGFMQGGSAFGTNATTNETVNTEGAGMVSGGYVGWAGVFAYFFSILGYTMLYLTVVQKSFTLITVLPDKILRWIGGQQESIGADTAQWGQEAQQKITEAGKDTASAQAQMDKQLTGYAGKAMGYLQGKAAGGKGGSASGQGGSAKSSGGKGNSAQAAAEKG